MDFLNNINKEFRLSSNKNFIKEKYHYILKSSDKILPEDVIVKVDECYIDETIINNLAEDEIDISCLLNWEVSYERKGEHHNDGQICDYTVTFTSPEGHEYHAYDSHCAITGWSFRGEVVID